MIDLDDVDPSILDLVRWIVDGRRPSDRTVTGSQWRSLCAEADRHRVLGGLHVAVADGWLRTDADAAAELDEQVVDRMRRCLSIESALIETVALLDEAGLDCFVLKGVASAHLDYPDPAMRAFNDVDILIPPEQIDPAAVALERAGFVRDLPPRSSVWDAQFAKDIPVVHPTGVEIDIHRSFAQGAFGLWIDPHLLAVAPERLRVGGVEMRACSPVVRAFQAVVGLTIGEERIRLAHLADLALLARRIDDPGELLQLCERCHATVLYEEALEACAGVAGAPVATASDQPFLRAVRPTRAERFARRSYRTAGGAHTRELLSGVMALSSPVALGRYARALLVPSQTYRRGRRTAGRVPEWREGARQVLGTARRP